MIITEDKHHLLQVLKAEIPTYEIQNLKMFDFGNLSTAFKLGLHRGWGWGGLLSPPPPLFCKNKSK